MGDRIARLFLWWTGWIPDGTPPESRKFVLIAAPHTSNWDLAYLLAFARIYDVKMSFMAKHTLFRWPLGWFMRRVGGIPVRRDRRSNLVRQMVKAFEERESLVLTIPPEGTRGRAPYWKSGFYQIAVGARVPIVTGYLDYARKRGGFGPEIAPSGNLREDMDEIRAFYAGKQGRFPEEFGDVRLKEEMEPL